MPRPRKPPVLYRGFLPQFLMIKKTQSKLKTIPTELHGGRISIRRVRISDAESIFRNNKSAKMTRWTLALPHPYPKSAAIKFINRSRRKWRMGLEYHFRVVLAEDNRLIGGVGLKNVDHRHHTAELGYGIVDKYWGQGYATEAAKLAMLFAFKHLKLYRIYACSFEGNIASWRVMEKCGMTREGVWREAIVKHGKRQNMVHYAILKPEYDKQVRKKAETKK
jgi:[ribosomal protein S5]-alanine N-acetyltransferase